HLANGERTVEYAHVRMHAHDEQRVDIAAAQEAVNFGAVVRDNIFRSNAEGWDLARPGFVELVRGVAAAIGIVDGQRRGAPRPRCCKFDLLEGGHALALGRVLVERRHSQGSVATLGAVCPGWRS